MDRWGIRTSVVSISDPGVYFGDADEAKETARLVNDAGAELIAADPRRWGGFSHFAYQNGGLFEVLLAGLIFAIAWPLRHRMKRTRSDSPELAPGMDNAHHSS